MSECSSPIASLNGTYDERCEQPIEYHNQEQTSPQQYEIVQSQNHLIDRTVQHELLNDMIVNDLVIINGNCLDSTADNLIENDFDKNDEINGSYFISSVHESSVCGSNNNESSNEVNYTFFKSIKYEFKQIQNFFIFIFGVCFVNRFL